jgi:Flp pilus assembly pilin Flp
MLEENAETQGAVDAAPQAQREWRDRGASIVEYALLVALIAVVCIGAVTFFGSSTGDSLSRSGESMFTTS